MKARLRHQATFLMKRASKLQHLKGTNTVILSNYQPWHRRGNRSRKTAWMTVFMMLITVAPLTAQVMPNDGSAAPVLLANTAHDTHASLEPTSLEIKTHVNAPDSLPDSPMPAFGVVDSNEPPQAQTQGQPPTTGAPPTATPAEKKQGCRFRPCPRPIIDWYKRFENGPQVKPLTPLEKGWLATRNLIDPFNLITIVGTAGITIAADSHSAYGPGFPGFGRYVGVTFTEDMTGEFFNTFLIPSIMHQDPHYHRMPKASYPRRIVHAIAQVAWTQSDDGRGMLNYGNLVGFAIDDEIGNLYVPGRRTNAGATAQRYVIGLATAPIDNFITEFLPDVAKHVHVQVVVVQRIINQIANKDSGGAF